MENILYAFLLCSIAGLSTLIGTIIIFINKKKNDNIIIGALSFASGVMLCVSFVDLIPGSFNLIKNIYNFIPTLLFLFISFISGIIFSMLIDIYLPDNYEKKNIDNSKLYRVGIIAMLAIVFHNMPEGIATFMTTNSSITLGISLCIAIALHNIPEGICISVPIYYATKSRGKAFIYTFISGLSEPLGGLIAYIFLMPFINDFIMGLLYAFIAGIMVHISIYELIPTSKKYNKFKITTIFFVVGVLFMLLNHLIII